MNSMLMILLIAAALWGLSGGARRAVSGHAHGSDRSKVAIHEAGHVVAARALGGRVRSAELYRSGGGLVTWDMPAKVSSPEAHVAFLLAGQYAAGTTAGCGGDQAAIRRELRGVPDASRVRARAEARAKSIVSANRSEIHRVAARLAEKGSL